MTVGMMKYKRTAQRLREKYKDQPFTKKDLEDAIFIECGTDQRTIKAAIDRMKRLKLMEELQEEREFGKERIEKYKLARANDEYF